VFIDLGGFARIRNLPRTIETNLIGLIVDRKDAAQVPVSAPEYELKHPTQNIHET
jgi:hypothetical protein